MKKLYIILLSICIIQPVLSQPVFTQANFLQIGATATTQPLDATGLSEGNSGANQTWNFSTAVSTGTPVTATMLAPASTPYASMYPGSNIAVHTTSSLGNDAYGFYNVTANYADLVGFGTHSPTADIFFTYSDPLHAIPFPFTYNTSVQDSYVAFSTYILSGLTVNDYRRGTISVLADAYGSITTPDNSYASSLRIVQSENVVDSIIITGFPSATMTVSNRTSYSWAPAGSFNSVFSIVYDTTDQGGGPQPSVSASYTTGTTGISEYGIPKALNVYPNPATKSSRVNINSDELESGSTTFRAIDMTGKIVKQIDFMLYSATHKSVSIDMSDCSSGLYQIQLVQKGKLFSSKFVLD